MSWIVECRLRLSGLWKELSLEERTQRSIAFNAAAIPMRHGVQPNRHHAEQREGRSIEVDMS